MAHMSQPFPLGTRAYIGYDTYVTALPISGGVGSMFSKLPGHKPCFLAIYDRSNFEGDHVLW
jgi:hypothetical protein